MSLFSKSAKAKDGLYSYCKPCTSKKKKEYNARPDVAKRKIEYERSKEYRDKKNAYRRALGTSDEDRERYRRLYEEKKVQRLQYQKDFRLSDRGKEYRRAQSLKETRELYDNYVRGLLSHGTSLRSAEIPSSLVEAKRILLLIERELREKR